MKNKRTFVFFIGFASLFAGSAALSNGLYLNGNSNIITNNQEENISAPTIDKIVVGEITNTSAIVHWNLTVPRFRNTTLDMRMVDNNDSSHIVKILDDDNQHLSGTSYTGTKKISKLTSGTNYSWKFIIDWNWNEGEETGIVEQDFEFQTIREAYDAPIIDSLAYKVFSNHAIINWNISDSNELITELKIVNEDTNDTINITNYKNDGSYDIKNLEPEEYYSLHLEAKWLDQGYINNNGVIITNSIEFTTLDQTWQEPVINSFSVDESWKTDSSIPVEWDISDINETVTDIKIVDENDLFVKDLGKELIGSKTIDGLDYSTSYNWKLVVNYENVEHGVISEVQTEFISFETFSSWEIPTINVFEITNITDDSALVSWDVLGIATNVVLYNNGSLFDPLTSTTSGEKTIQLTPDTPYNFELVIEWNNGINNYYLKSETISFTTSEFIAPVIDTFNISVIDDTSVNVDWSVTDVNLNSTGVRIVDANTDDDTTTDDDIANLDTSLSGSQTINGLIPNTTYDWKLAVDWKDSSQYKGKGTVYSEDVEFTTDEAIEFIEPEINNFSVDPSTNSADISWNVSDESGSITNIKVVDRWGNLIKDLKTTLSGNQTINGLSSNTEYKWKLVVEYTDEDGSSASIKSNLVDFWTDENIFIDPVINSFDVNSITNSSADISWNVSDESGSITDIKVIDENDNLVEDLKTTLNETQTIDGLSSNTEYNWKLVVEYTDGIGNPNSIESSLVDFWTIRDQYSAPIIETFNVESNNIGTATINWVINDPNGVTSHVKVINDNNELVLDLDTNLTGSVDVTDLTPGGQYNWKLVVEWDDELYLNETLVESNFVYFTVMNKEEKNDENNNFVIILTLVIVLTIIIIGGGALIALSNKK